MSPKALLRSFPIVALAPFDESRFLPSRPFQTASRKFQCQYDTTVEIHSQDRNEIPGLPLSTSQPGQQAKSLGLCPKVGSEIHLFSSRRLGCSRILQTSKRLAGGVHVCSLEKGAYSQVRFVTPGCCGSVPKRPKRGVAAPSPGSSEFAASRSNPGGPTLLDRDLWREFRARVARCGKSASGS